MLRFQCEKAGGAEGNRTPDLCSAIAALSHLSYSPASFPGMPGGAAFSGSNPPLQLGAPARLPAKSR